MPKKQQIIGITGAAGFIGSHLSKALVEKGYKVIAADNLTKGSRNNIKDLISNNNFIFSQADITDAATVNRIFNDVNVIVHLAAAKIPRYGHRLETLIVNSEGTKNVLEVLKKKKSRIIFASTSDVYGKSPNLPFIEGSDLVIGPPEVARWAYAVSKIFDEQLLFAYNEAYGIPFTIIRFFGVYGPKQHRSWLGGPQSLFIDEILGDRYIEIHGDGRQTRTFIYIDDVVEAISKCIESKIDGEILNIGTTREISIIEFAQLIASLTGRNLKMKKIPYKSFTGKKYEDVQRRVPDIEKAKRVLRWIPKITLEEGLIKTIEWHKHNPK